MVFCKNLKIKKSAPKQGLKEGLERRRIAEPKSADRWRIPLLLLVK